ncbi:extracellular solute-binding protein [Streptomyces sp. A7024]|uniref:Extracellular solute-binding protein n=1 Tax=Streptomyces coryli TaxID=1128680 RepID=A0A6G4TTH3_9ACTN|nr:extracellular solute-binding protein [Streptomyces coryli]NGN63319.1 extracellular solute-binding protein [Streptomyces coryli]
MVSRTKPAAALLLAGALLAAAGCSGGGGTAGGGEEAKPPSDPKSVSGDITVLTNRSDLVQNGTMKKYAAEFRKTYPKVKVEFETATDYEGEIKTRMNTEDYGDVLLIPNTVSKGDYPKFFASLGPEKDLVKTHRFTDKTEVKGKVYGIATFGAATGFVYNKAVWKKAGVTDWPKTPDAFIAALKKIKSKTGATPYYTNFKDGWPLTNWTNFLGSPTCDAQANNKLAASDDPWQGSLKTVDTLLHDIVKNKVSEKDPTTTNWEKSKGQLAKGDIATMALGSWAISQIQAAAKQAGANPDDIGFLPFPAQSDGKFCSMLIPDYQQAVNIHSEHKEAARAWIDWMAEKSGYAQTEQAVSVLKKDPMPAALKDYTAGGVRYVPLSNAKFEQVSAIDNASEVGLNKQDYRQRVIDLARGAKSGSLTALLDELAGKWADARGEVGP